MKVFQDYYVYITVYIYEYINIFYKLLVTIASSYIFNYKLNHSSGMC